MDIEQYQPSPKMLALADVFCTFFGKQPLYYSFDLGNRVTPVRHLDALSGTCFHHETGRRTYRQVVQQIATSHQVEQLVIVVEEALRCFPQYSYTSEQCCGLIGGICGGRVMQVILHGIKYRAIVLTAGVVWLDRIPQQVLNPDNPNWIAIANAVDRKRKHILREQELLKKLFR
jgi:hypothetical protein